MSNIPKIKIGKPQSNRSKFVHSQTTSSTTNFGFCQPTFCREYIEGAKINFSPSSIVQASPLTFPTFGQLSLRHYIAYVPYSSIWSQFPAFYSGQNYMLSGGNSIIPSHTPRISLDKVALRLLHIERNGIFTDDGDKITVPLLPVDAGDFGEHFVVGGNVMKYFDIPVLGLLRTSDDASAKENYLNSLIHSNNHAYDFIITFASLLNRVVYTATNENALVPFLSYDGDVLLYVMTSDSSGTYSFNYIKTVEKDSEIFNFLLPYITDFNIEHTVFVKTSYDMQTDPLGTDKTGFYHLGFMPSKAFKDLRKVFVGLGMQFPSQYDAYNEDMSRRFDFYYLDGEDNAARYNSASVEIFKILAFYKVWFNLFYPQRDINFSSTNCYKVIKLISETPIYNLNQQFDLSDSTSHYVVSFFDDLVGCYYYKAPDYFSSSILSQTQSLNDDYNINSSISLGKSTFVNTSEDGTIGFEAGNVQSLRLAQRLLRFVNRNTIIGKSIYNWYKSTFGITDKHDSVHNEIDVIGAVREGLNIGTVINQSEGGTTDGGLPFGNYLGSYAGRCVGFTNNKKHFVIEGKSYGCLICITTIVPETDYYQGVLRENLPCDDRFGKYSPDFDAMGYQELGFAELNGDLHDSRVFGLVPFYQHLKVPSSIVNGDLSDISTKDSMLGYTLNRDLSSEFGELSNTPDFRKIGDTFGNDGNYNRIFRYVKNDQDHFIFHIVFDVDFTANMKAISEAYDTDENAPNVATFNHE